MANLISRTTEIPAPSAPRLPRDTSDKLPASGKAKTRTLDHNVREADADNDAAFSTHQQSIKRFQSSQAEYGWDQKAAATSGVELAAPAVAFHEDNIRRLGEHRATAEKAMKAKSLVLGNRRTLLNAANGYVGALREVAPEVKADGEPDKGQTAKQTVARLRGQIDDLRKEAHATSKAAPGIEHAMAEFATKLDAFAETAAYEVVRAGNTFDLRFPVVPVLAEAAGGMPVAFDPRPAYVAEHREEILAKAREAIRAHYEDNVVLVLNVDQKRKRLRQIANETLALERRECAVIWAARDEDEVIEFRPDTDVRALLGIDGPPPPKVERRL